MEKFALDMRKYMAMFMPLSVIISGKCFLLTYEKLRLRKCTYVNLAHSIHFALELPLRELLPTAGTEALPIRFIDCKGVVSFMACIASVKMNDQFCPSHVLFIRGRHLLT